MIDQVKDVETGYLSWIIQVDPKCNHKCPRKREAAGDLTEEDKTHTEEKTM